MASSDDTALQPGTNWSAGTTFRRGRDGCYWTISLPADFAPGVLDAAVAEALRVDALYLAALALRNPAGVTAP